MSRVNIVRNVNDHEERNYSLLKLIHERLKNFFTDKVFVTFYNSETSLSFFLKARTMNAKVVNLFKSVNKA